MGWKNIFYTLHFSARGASREEEREFGASAAMEGEL